MGAIDCVRELENEKRPPAQSISVCVANSADREEIYRIRHEVYSQELHQHPGNAASSLRDSLDEANVYIVVAVSRKIAGFVSVTPPRAATYSIDKYFARDTLGFAVDDGLYEIRLLTVLK